MIRKVEELKEIWGFRSSIVYEMGYHLPEIDRVSCVAVTFFISQIVRAAS